MYNMYAKYLKSILPLFNSLRIHIRTIKYVKTSNTSYICIASTIVFWPKHDHFILFFTFSKQLFSGQSMIFLLFFTFRNHKIPVKYIEDVEYIELEDMEYFKMAVLKCGIRVKYFFRAF